jgi:two-component system sensor histidine kinase KdpD
VRVRLGAGEVVVSVEDDGPGFAAGEEERLFDKFYRGAGGPGAGLGLAIARAIVTAHGGRIWAERRSPHGAAFRFTLPIGGDRPPPLPAEEDA